MSRDDSMLYAGSSSASFAAKRVLPTEKKHKLEKDEKRLELQPQAGLVFETIKAEKDSVLNITKIDISGVKDERMFMAEMMARQMYVEYLDRLALKLQIILKEKK